MGDYVCLRVWEVRPGALVKDVEELAKTGVLEMQRWIPGVKRVSLVLLQDEPQRYVMTTSFVDHAAFTYWRQVEDEASDYWERFASVQLHWEQLCMLASEYAGEIVMDVTL